MRILTIFASLVFLIFCKTAMAQQEVLYTQYVYNELAINPAYAGYQDALNITLNSRKQWVGLEGSPLTTTIAAHTVLNSNNPECNIFKEKKRGGLKPSRTKSRTGLGFLFFNDQIGVDNTMQGTFSYSHKIIFRESRLSLGLQSSVISYTQNLLDIDNNSLIDPVFDENNQKLLINFGAGLFFDNDRYYFGLSVPQIIKNNLNYTLDGDSYQLRQAFATGGYIFFLNRNFKLKPTFMFRYTEDLPFQFDLNSTIIYKDMFYFGLAYRNKKTLSSIIQFSFDKKMRLGLAYDYYVTNEFKKAANGSVEVLFYYNFRNSIHKVVNPRYF